MLQKLLWDTGGQLDHGLMDRLFNCFESGLLLMHLTRKMKLNIRVVLPFCI